MKIYFILPACIALIVSGCGGNTHTGSNGQLYGEMDNMREFGTVVSVSETSHVEANGLGTAAAGSSAAVAGSSASAALSSTIFSPFGSLFSSAGSNAAYNSSSSASVDNVMHLIYVIQKDNGETVTIDQTPQQGDSIIYRGQKVMIQKNGDYLRVYPADVEHTRNTSG